MSDDYQERLAEVRKRNGITHDHLLAVVKIFPEDWPQGNPDYTGDCSCGCKWYVGLEEGFVGDWGVCTNPKSYRCGLLTFEHQGCIEFEHDDEWEAEFLEDAKNGDLIGWDDVA